MQKQMPKTKIKKKEKRKDNKENELVKRSMEVEAAKKVALDSAKKCY